MRKVIVIGFDGLDPGLTQSLMERGQLPHFRRLRALGGMGRVATTQPAQTPVAWSTFATGTNPGGHGIFDFLRRDPSAYRLELGLNRFEQSNPLVPPRVVNQRRGTTVWERLSQADIPSIVLRCPCTFPPEKFRGRLLAGMGVPDLRGSLGMASFFTSDAALSPGESESLVQVAPQENTIRTRLSGPLHPGNRKPAEAELQFQLDPLRRQATASSGNGQVSLSMGQWSDWLKVHFSLGLLRRVTGRVRFYLVSLEPHVAIYASPVNFDADAPPFAISSPPRYAAELQQQIGPFHTTGMVEDHGGLENGRLDEQAFLQQCDQVWAERQAMMLHELQRFDAGLFFCLFDTPDRVQHMFWNSQDPLHPSYCADQAAEGAAVIEDQYRRADQVLGQVLEYVDDQTLLIVLSDHGFNSFRRGVHLNTWLHEQGLLHLKDGARPGDGTEDYLQSIDWSRTQAYALGIGGIYLNRCERERQGTVRQEDASPLLAQIQQRLTALRDEQNGCPAVRRVLTREQIYSGPFAQEAPDLLVNFAAGYRASWETAVGGVPSGQFADNTRRWSGDHIVDPALVPGVLLMNQPYQSKEARLVDLAPTILDALSAPAAADLEGTSLLA